MSTVLEKVSDEINAARMSEQEMKRRRPSGKHLYKPRLATKVKWALGDAMERSIAAQKQMRKCLDWLEETHRYDIDDRAKAHLGKLELELFGLAVEVSEMERILATTMTESKPAATKGPRRLSGRMVRRIVARHRDGDARGPNHPLGTAQLVINTTPRCCLGSGQGFKTTHN